MAREVVEKARVYAGLLRTSQIIASPVIDEHGLVVVGEGTEVTDKTIALIRMSGVKTVEIRENRAFRWQLYISEEDRMRQIRERVLPLKNTFMDSIASALERLLADRNRKNGK